MCKYRRVPFSRLSNFACALRSFPNSPGHCIKKAVRITHRVRKQKNLTRYFHIRYACPGSNGSYTQNRDPLAAVHTHGMFQRL